MTLNFFNIELKWVWKWYSKTTATHGTPQRRDSEVHSGDTKYIPDFTNP